MISTLKTAVLVTATLVAVSLLLFGNFNNIMQKAKQLLIPQTKDPSDDSATSYEQTRASYNAFDELKNMLTAANNTGKYCVSSHKELPSSIIHPHIALSDKQSSDTTKSLFLRFENTGSGSELTLYQMRLKYSEDLGDYSLEDVEKIDSIQTSLKPCLIGNPNHNSETFLRQLLNEYIDKNQRLEGVSLGRTITSNLRNRVSGNQIRESAVQSLWWRDPRTIVINSDGTNNPEEFNPLEEGYDQQLGVVETTPYSIPSGSGNHPVIKFDADDYNDLQADHLCFVAAGRDTYLPGEDEYLSSDTFGVLQRYVQETDKTCEATT